MFIGTWLFNWKEEKNLEWIGITIVFISILLLLLLHVLRYFDFISLKKKSDLKNNPPHHNPSIKDDDLFSFDDNFLFDTDRNFIYIMIEIVQNLFETLKTIQIDELSSNKEDFRAFSGFGYCPNVLLAAWIWIFWLIYDLVINELFNNSYIIEKGLFLSVAIIFIVLLTYFKNIVMNKKLINMLFILNIIIFLLPFNYFRTKDNVINEVTNEEYDTETSINNQINYRFKFILFQILRTFLFFFIFILIELNYIARWKIDKIINKHKTLLPLTSDGGGGKRFNNLIDNISKTQIQIKIIQTFWILLTTKSILIPCFFLQFLVLSFNYINYRKKITIYYEKLAPKHKSSKENKSLLVVNTEIFDMKTDTVFSAVTPIESTNKKPPPSSSKKILRSSTSQQPKKIKKKLKKKPSIPKTKKTISFQDMSIDDLLSVNTEVYE